MPPASDRQRPGKPPADASSTAVPSEQPQSAERLTYRSAGVDLELYDEAMTRLPPLMRRTFSDRVIEWAGGFAGLFRLNSPGKLFQRQYTDPVLVSGTDGVGTKLKVAQRVGRHDTIGIDLVAMCVNDVLAAGAEPLFFLDYVAMSHDDPAWLEQIVRGISDGCMEADCALLGGETAIMPDQYAHGDYDLAGFCVAVVEREEIIDGRAIDVDDVVIGLASSGLHSNGFSLARKIVFEHAGLDLDTIVDGMTTPVGQWMLEPTRIYARAVRAVLDRYRTKHVVHGIAHITGSGLAHNLARIIPPGKQAKIRRGTWPVPPEFTFLARAGRVDGEEMFRVFNMGVGLVLVVSPYFADSVLRTLNADGWPAWLIGNVVAGDGGVVLVD